MSLIVYKLKPLFVISRRLFRRHYIVGVVVRSGSGYRLWTTTHTYQTSRDQRYHGHGWIHVGLSTDSI